MKQREVKKKKNSTDGRIPIETFPSHMHHRSTVVEHFFNCSKKLPFFFQMRVEPIKIPMHRISYTVAIKKIY